MEAERAALMRLLSLLGIGLRRLSQGRLRKHMLLPSPFEQFRLWHDEAGLRSGMINPNACCLCTAGPEGRMVLLKGFDTSGFVFFTNYQSAKARSLTRQKAAELVFYWDAMGRQARVLGKVEKCKAGESDAYFATRARSSQIAAWASKQSQTAESREAMDSAYKIYEAKFEGRPVPRPPHWGGFRLRPSRFEFWQADPFRFHDRFHYKKSGSAWKIIRLYP